MNDKIITDNTQMCINQAKIYKDADDNDVTLRQLIKLEPEWAHTRIRSCEIAEDKVKTLEIEVAELKVMVNELRKHYEIAFKTLQWSWITELLEKTPQQSLLEHDKRVIEKILESLDTQVDGWSLNAIKEYIKNMEEDDA